MTQYQHRLTFIAVVAIIICGCTSHPAHGTRARGNVDSIDTVRNFSRESMDKANLHIALSGEALCDVKVVQLTYESIGVKGEPVRLSAGLYVPENCAAPVSTHCRGTRNAVQ